MLSLDETTGKIVPAKIKGLLDMGVKPVYKLTTKNGRSIRTTGNHPYLVRQKESSINQSDSGFSQNGQFAPQISAGFDRRQESQNDLNNFTLAHLSNQDNNNSVAFTDAKAKNVAETSVKTQQDSFILATEVEDGVVVASGKTSLFDSQNINPVFAQTQNNIGVNALIGQNFEDHSLSGSDFQNFLFSQDAAGITKSNFGIGNGDTGVLSGNIIKTVSSLQKIQDIGDGNSRALNAGFAEPDSLLNDNSRGDSGNVVHSNNYTNPSQDLSNSQWLAMSEVEWTKVVYLSIGDEIAVADGDKLKWSKITSIEQLPPEQVYDIEVEGTHNFIANGILAHNTYISGNVGIGTTAPGEKLTIRDPNIASDAASGEVRLRFDSGNGGGGIGFAKETFNTGGLRFYTQYGYGTFVEKMRITSTGNVGIGTTTPGYKLDVSGNVRLNNLVFANPGVGNDTRLTFLKTNDAAWISVKEETSDRTRYAFEMSDNPDTTADKFLWYISDWKGKGGDWEPLNFNNLNANIRAANVNAYGDYNIYGPWYSGSGQPNTVWESKSGTLTVTPGVSGFTGTYRLYGIEIDGTGTPNTFKWFVNKHFSGTPTATNVAITGSAQTLDNGVTIKFSATTGGVLGDRYQFRVYKGGHVLADTGAVGAPSFSFTADSNTGMYRGGADNLRLVTDGADRLTIDSNGNVGIGTTEPSALLNLKGTLSSALTGTVAVTNLSTAVVGTGTLFTTELAVDDSIKIGSEIFTVSAITDALNLTLDSAYQGSTASGLTAYRDPTLFAIDNGDAVNKLTITRSGNVGIGTSTPAYKLQIAGDIVPTDNSLYSLGTSTLKWANIFAATTTVGDLVFGNNFRITEATSTEGLQTIVFKNHNGQDIMSLDENGNLIVPGSILSASSSGSGVGFSSSGIIGSLVDQIKSILSSLGLLIESGVASVQKLVASFIQTQDLEIGTSENPSGFTIYDKITKQPYCVTMESGEIVKIQGKCDTQTTTNSNTENSITTEQTTTDNQITTNETATSTDSTSTASSTETTTDQTSSTADTSPASDTNSAAAPTETTTDQTTTVTSPETTTDVAPSE